MKPEHIKELRAYASDTSNIEVRLARRELVELLDERDALLAQLAAKAEQS